MKLTVIILNGNIVGAEDVDNSCNPRATGAYCGGCSRCLLAQASHYGYKLVDVVLRDGETLSDAVSRTEDGTNA